MGCKTAHWGVLLRGRLLQARLQIAAWSPFLPEPMTLPWPCRACNKWPGIHPRGLSSGKMSVEPGSPPASLAFCNVFFWVPRPREDTGFCGHLPELLSSCARTESRTKTCGHRGVSFLEKEYSSKEKTGWSSQ